MFILAPFNTARCECVHMFDTIASPQQQPGTEKKTRSLSPFFPTIIMDSISLFNIRYDRFVYKFIFWQQLQKS